MRSRFDLVGEQSYRVRLNAPKEPDRFGRYMVYEFRAKPTAAAVTNTETAGRSAVKQQHKYNGREKREKTQNSSPQSVGHAAWR